MEMAIKLASKDYKKGGGYAVSSIIVKDDKIIAKSITTINKKQDPTCHAEINAIRTACKKFKSKRLEGCYIYTTYEPCPMCAAAAVWARMEGIVYGASMEDETKINPQRIKIRCQEVIDKGTPRLKVYPDFIREECKKLLLL